MALNIIKPNEPIQINAIKVYIYGDPSIGKTSLAMTARNALVIDADMGAYRAGKLRRSPVQPVQHWNNVSTLSEVDIKPYDTIVIDTVGRLLEVIKASFAESQNNTMGNGALKQNAYTPINNAFSRFVNTCINAGKDVVFLAHATEDKDGDTVIKRPDLSGKNRNDIYRLSDCMAYMTCETNRSGQEQKILNFKHSSAYHTKDCAELGNIKVPDLTNNATFLGDLIANIKEHLNTLTPEQKLHIEQEQQWVHWQQQCHEANYASDFNNLMDELSQNKASKYYRNMWECLKYCALELDLDFNESSKRWKEKATA